MDWHYNLEIRVEGYSHNLLHIFNYITESSNILIRMYIYSVWHYSAVFINSFHIWHITNKINHITVEKLHVVHAKLTSSFYFDSSRSTGPSRCRWCHNRKTFWLQLRYISCVIASSSSRSFSSTSCVNKCYCGRIPLRHYRIYLCYTCQTVHHFGEISLGWWPNRIDLICIYG